MGVIKRQSIKQSLVNYIAVAIGAISIIYIYPQEKSTYGLARFIIDTSMMIAPFMMLGLSGVSVRFFPRIKQGTEKAGFLMFLVLGVLFGSVLFAGLAFLLKQPIYHYFSDKPALFLRYLPYLIPIGILLAFFQLLYSYTSNFKLITIPSVFQNLIKISLPLLMLGFIAGMISTDTFVQGILINFVFAVLGLLVYLFYLGELKLGFRFDFLQEHSKEIRTFALFGLFASLGSVLAFRIDSVMISTLLDFDNNGVFAIAAFIANVIAIPTNAVNQISAPIISESFKKDDLSHIGQIYRDSSINLLVIGLLLFVCIAISIEDLFSIMPEKEGFGQGVGIVIIVGAAKLIDMGTSVNNQIINYSKYYKFGFYALLMMALFNIIANYLLIPRFGITGAAIATLLSLTLYNLLKLLFIQWRFGMQPFSRNTLILGALAILVYGIGWLIPDTGSPYFNIILRSLVVGLLYTFFVYRLKISNDVNQMIESILKKVRR